MLFTIMGMLLVLTVALVLARILLIAYVARECLMWWYIIPFMMMVPGFKADLIWVEFWEFGRQIGAIFSIFAGLEQGASPAWGEVLFFIARLGYLLSVPYILLQYSLRAEADQQKFRMNLRLFRRFLSKKQDSVLVKWFWRKLAIKRKHPENGVIIGSTGRGLCKLIDEELNSGCLILGATGAGKTTAILNITESACQRGLPVIFVDGKGDGKKDKGPPLAEILKSLAGAHGRKFYLFSLGVEGQKSMNYNPLRHGDYSELKDKLICTSEWTEPHFRFEAERYLQLAIRLLKQQGLQLDLPAVVENIQPPELLAVARALKDKKAMEIIEKFEEKDTVQGMVNRLALFTESSFGDLLREQGEVIDLVKAIDENAVVLFSLNSLKYQSFTDTMGKLIVMDMKSAIARESGEPKKIYSILDEFSNFAGPQVRDLINKIRSAGGHNILGTQALSDLKMGGGGEELKDAILANTNVKIIMRQDSIGVESLSELAGTRDEIHITQRTEWGQVVEKKGGTIGIEESFSVHPNEIKRLKRGEAVLLVKHPAYRIERVQIRVPQIPGSRENLTVLGTESKSKLRFQGEKPEAVATDQKEDSAESDFWSNLKKEGGK